MSPAIWTLFRRPAIVNSTPYCASWDSAVLTRPPFQYGPGPESAATLKRGGVAGDYESLVLWQLADSTLIGR